MISFIYKNGKIFIKKKGCFSNMVSFLLFFFSLNVLVMILVPPFFLNNGTETKVVFEGFKTLCYVHETIIGHPLKLCDFRLWLVLMKKPTCIYRSINESIGLVCVIYCNVWFITSKNISARATRTKEWASGRANIA